MLKILGDICFADGYFDVGMGVGTAVSRGANPFCHLQRNPGDYWIGNFESVCATDNSIKPPFYINASMMGSVQHLDLYGVANNHVMQHGESAYRGLLSYIDSIGAAYAGAADKHSHRFEHQGRTVGLMAFCQRPDNFTKRPLYWHLPEYSEVKAEVSLLSDCDYRIAYIHWGNEFIDYPYNDQKQFAHFLVECGVNLVVGMHPHVMQGHEHYNGGDIYYSLGNCVFNMPWEPTKYGLMLTVDIESGEVTSDYLKIGADYFPSVVNEVPEQFTQAHLSSLLSISEENEKYYRKVYNRYHCYRKANRKDVVKQMFKMPLHNQATLLSDFVKRRLLKR